MKPLSTGFLFCSFLGALVYSACSPSAPLIIENPPLDVVVQLDPPVAARIPHTTEIHGLVLEDDYYWMRERENPEVIAYLEAENAYTEAMTAHTEGLQQTLYQEMVGRIQETDLSVPYQHGDYMYYSRTEEGADYGIFCRRAGSMDEGEEEILLDENVLAEGNEYMDVGIRAISPDHNILAYGVDTDGSETYTVYFKNLATGEVASESLEGVSYSLEWANDSATVFYTVDDEAHRPYQVYR